MPTPVGANPTFPLVITEHCDVETSSESYASRFQGRIGSWMLEVQRRATMLLLGALPPGSTVLDVGGGHGQLTGALLEKGWEVVVAGSDSSCKQRVAPYLSTHCHFDVVDLERLPYPAQCFDAVLSIRLLGHANHWETVLAELCRVAKRSVVIDYASFRSTNLFAETLFAVKQRAEKSGLRPRHFRVFHTREIDSAFQHNGFRVAETYRQFLWPMFVHRVVRLPAISALLEAPGRAIGVTRFLGSPVLARADRIA
jgi:ubiquinone/menaquinone biosynthesis C-methylase UbiE